MVRSIHYRRVVFTTVVWAAWLMVIGASSAAPGSKATGDSSSMTAAKAQKILAHIRPRAKQGQADAQYNLGVMYANGYGVAKNWAKARKWYKKAASQHQPKAEQNLGVMYAKGQGVAIDQSKAAHWFGRAARDGEPAAQNNLAVLYARGEGVAKNLGQAAIWAARALRGGNTEAKKNLKGIVGQLPERYVVADGTAVRSTPDGQTHVATHLGRGAKVALLTTRSDWSRVLLLESHRPGWVKTKDLANQKLKPRAQKTVSQSHQPQQSHHKQVAANNSSHAKSGNKTQPANSNGSGRGQAVHGATAKRVVAANSVNVHDKPARSARVKFQVDTGTHLTVQRQWKGWMLATFPDGRKGWIAGFLLKK